MARPISSKSNKLTTRELVTFSMLGTLMLLGKLLMDWAPNIHFVGMLTVTYTVVYRARALLPIYLFVLLEGIYGGFGLWWVPSLYLWALLWGAAMLLPRDLPPRTAVAVYAAVCGLHGLLYGTLYAPFQALAFHLGWKGMLAWIVAGLPFDAVHALGNAAAGTLVLPLSRLLRRLERSSHA